MKLTHLLIASAFIFTASSQLKADQGDISPARPVIPSARFSLKDFGATADGTTMNTEAFNRALRAVTKSGGGTLIVPEGDYLTGPIELPSSIDLHLEKGAKIHFSTNPRDYSSSHTRKPVQLAVNFVHDVVISGSGEIDVNGQIWWPAANAMRDPKTGKQYNGTTLRPSLMTVTRSYRIKIEGVTLTRSPGLNLGISESTDVTIDRVTILNPATSPNTDGIDPKGAQRVLISNCYIDTGDDCIAAGGSKGMLEKDILVTDCTFIHGHGCSIGSGTAGGVENFKVRRCSFNGTETGVRLKSSRGRGGLTDNVIYEDLTMDHVGRAISINSHYEGTTVDLSGIGEVAAEPVTKLTPIWNHVIIRNIRSINGTRDGGLILGLPEMPIQNIHLDNIELEAPEGMQIAYTKDISLKNVVIKAAHGKSLNIAPTVENFSQK